MKKLIITVLFILPTILLGQQWSQTFGDILSDNGNSVKQTSDGGFIVCGSTSSFGNGGMDVYLVKTDESGQEQWSQTFGDTLSDTGNSVQQTSDGGFIVCGSTSSFGNGGGDVYLVKTDENGQEQWSQTFGDTLSDSGNSVQQTSDGGFIMCGTTDSFYGNGGSDVYLIKTDENGQEQWSQTFGDTLKNDISNSVQQTSDGGFIVCGSTRVFGNEQSDVYLVKTDENGEEQWGQTFGDTLKYDTGHSVHQTSDGGFILCGRSFLGNNVEMYLVKIDENGQEQWIQDFEDTIDDGNSIEQTNDGGFIVLGNSIDFSNGITGDMVLMKLDENGQEQWSQTFGGPGLDLGKSVQQTSDGGFIMCGTINSLGNGGNDVYLVKSFPPMSPQTNIELIGCDSIQGVVNDLYFYQSGVYIDTLTNIFIGDSIITQDVIIYESPENNLLTGNNDVTTLTIETYQTSTSSENELEWSVIGGLLFQDLGNSIEVLWGNEGDGTVELTETSGFGCSTTNILEVNISDESTSIDELTNSRRLIKTINVLGNEITPKLNTILIQFYDDGSVEKKLIIE